MMRSSTKAGSPRFKFLGESIAELKKVVWLSRKEATYLTLLVLIVSITAGLVLGVIDYVFSGLVNLFLGG